MLGRTLIILRFDILIFQIFDVEVRSEQVIQILTLKRFVVIRLISNEILIIRGHAIRCLLILRQKDLEVRLLAGVMRDYVLGGLVLEDLEILHIARIVVKTPFGELV